MRTRDFHLEELTDPEEMRTNILVPITKLKIPKDELIVVGGAALQIFGIKVSADIDLVLSPNRMQIIMDKSDAPFSELKLGHRGLQPIVDAPERGQLVDDEGYGVTTGNITYMLAPDDHLYRATFEELHDEAVDFEGVLVSPPARILAWKEGVKRAKDVADIELIQAFLEVSS